MLQILQHFYRKWIIQWFFFFFVVSTKEKKVDLPKQLWDLDTQIPNGKVIRDSQLGKAKWSQLPNHGPIHLQLWLPGLGCFKCLTNPTQGAVSLQDINGKGRVLCCCSCAIPGSWKSQLFFATSCLHQAVLWQQSWVRIQVKVPNIR